MSATLSTMLELGTTAPFFELPDTEGNLISLDDIHAEKGLLIMFICNHCPYVIHLNEALVDFANEYSEQGIECIAISSNDIESYPQDSPKFMKELSDKYQFPYPYLFDESQEVAKAYKAACTPDFFLFNNDLKLVYRGQFDDSRPGNGKPVTGKDMRNAADTLIKSKETVEPQIPSMGCNIKWKDGNEPNYFK
ncbi:MAG TPA: thioredoxin family protein [Balneola sp.]|jgi:peroxiredoxin|nr:thioredoxin family protein [Bacteroidota bacterium]MAC04851.1 thioredoxin family protein [Balneola sp.]MAO78768.1 thioredoxin family protein [Balneola sp.]MBF64717.1 thioredoxin family protein [Balneola sp.]HAH51515.1 thioredoxin family protein [Balneola sp.]|tara:strand:- start:4703 stop:5281 length:579 start_codon:yes stop_codon:yes gene_type:complete